MTGEFFWTEASLREALSEVLVNVVNGRPLSAGRITTDSRQACPGAVFVALRGERFDGQAFAKTAAESGAEALVVRGAVDAPVPQFVVTDTGRAYGLLAAYRRRVSGVPLLLVAGANGKTTVTQMSAGILRAAFGEDGMLATEKNFNNGVGVPRTLLQIHPQVRAAVVEAGISHPGEMADLASWAQPDACVITNAQREHQEFLGSVETSARENGLAVVALEKSGTAVLPAADPMLPIWTSLARARGCRVLTYAAGDVPADVRAVRLSDGRAVLRARGEEAVFGLEAQGAHMLHDAVAAAAGALALGIPLEKAAQGLAAFRQLPGRGQRSVLSTGAVLLDESYNANPDSLRATLDVLAQLPRPRVLVTADMLELGPEGPQWHFECGQHARECGVETLLCTGEIARRTAEGFGEGARHFDTLEELTAAALEAARAGGSILVKASCSMGLAAVVRALRAAYPAGPNPQ